MAEKTTYRSKGAAFNRTSKKKTLNLAKRTSNNDSAVGSK